MYNSYNLEATDKDSCLRLFKIFLCAEKISKGSVRSYLSDIRFFFSWLDKFFQENLNQTTETQSLPQLFSFISPRALEAYRSSLLDNQTPVTTINRRFSSLRKFGSFCQTKNWVQLNHFDTLRNISLSSEGCLERDNLTREFRLHLWKNKASKATIKNYLNDVKQFLEWQERQKNI